MAARRRPQTCTRAAGGWFGAPVVEARIERLQAAVEGLQDAIHRRAVRIDERLDELGGRTEPHRIARAFSQNARKRGP
jgi:hypothetical protein